MAGIGALAWGCPVAVWCFQGDYGQWRPYEPLVCGQLEAVYKQHVSTPLALGSISSSLAKYEVNFTTMKQRHIHSGTERQIKRFVRGPSSCLQNGMWWEVEGDHSSQWIVFDLDTMDAIDAQLINPVANSLLDLRPRLPYILDLTQLTQTRCSTGRTRQIRRRQLHTTFPPASPSQPLSGTNTVSQQLQQQGASTLIPTLNGATKSSQMRYMPYTMPSVTSRNISSSGGTSVRHAPTQGCNALSRHLWKRRLQGALKSQVNARRSLRNILKHSGSATSMASSQPAPHPQVLGQQIMQLQQQLQQQHLHQPSLQLQPLFMQQQQQQPQLPFQQMQQQLSLIQQPPLIQQQQPASSIPSYLQNTATPQESLPTEKTVTLSKQKDTKAKSGSEVLSRYMEKFDRDLDKEDCCICCDKLSQPSSYGEGGAEAHEAVRLSRCGHVFHKLCLLEMYAAIHKDDSLQCPNCKTIYGEKTGNCPPGHMTWELDNRLSLPGYDNIGTIVVSYHISPGVQGPEHPSPGQRYSCRGFPRQGFIPDCDKGRKVLKLLMEAFRRRLMFTIGPSHTTGESNTVTWNEIHHKTEPYGNYSGHGYPDPNYLDNVLLELAAHGVTEESLS